MLTDGQIDGRTDRRTDGRTTDASPWQCSSCGFI